MVRTCLIVQRKDGNDWVKSCINFEFDSTRGVGGWLVSTWEDARKDDLTVINITGEEWQDRNGRTALNHSHQQPR